MYLKSIIALGLIIFIIVNKVEAQKVDTTKFGVVMGVLKDNTHKYVVKSGTISIYNAQNNQLVAYQLSNNLGKFHFKQIPVGVLLRAIATSFGYKETKKEFVILSGSKTVDLGVLDIERADWMLKDVTIRSVVPPIQMRGDTLEFNAAAFKLDTTAVVGDLLRKLPGVTLWSDGIITVNGKKISRLLVDGKEFFGSDNRVVLENLPKNSVQKIQVYQAQGDKDPLNAKSEMNIVLKADKKDGFFGKIGVGYAFDRHYAFDGMLSYFSPRSQLSVVGAANDVNKLARNVNTLIGFNSFKGEGINSDYHSDFKQTGLNVFRGTGLTYTHDFSEVGDSRKSYYKANILKEEIFYSNGENSTLQESETVINLRDNHTIKQSSENNRWSNNSGFRSNGSYEKRFKHGYLSTNYNYSRATNNARINNYNNSFNDLTLEKSQSVSEQNDLSSQQSFSASVQASTERFYDLAKRHNRLLNLDFLYSVDFDDNDKNNLSNTKFTSTNAALDRDYNRRYIENQNSSTHTISVILRQINGLFSSVSPRLIADLTNIVVINDQKANVNVTDISPINFNVNQNNTDLTNQSNYITIDEKPGISISRSYNKFLDSRYDKSFTFNVLVQQQFFIQKSTAIQTIQNLSRSNSFFVPTARLSFANDQYGEFKNEFSINYLSSVLYPSIPQLAPLIDQANIYSITTPNLSLKPAYSHQVNFNFNYQRQKGKSDINANIDISVGLVERNITDSVYYDEFGRTVRRYVNGTEKRSLSLSGRVNKSFKFGDHQIQLSGNTSEGYFTYNTFININNYLTRSLSSNAGANITYSYKSMCSAMLSESYSGNNTKQGEINELTFKTRTTNFDLAFAFPRSLFFNSRVNFNNSKASSVNRNVNYTIWNLDLGYRFLKGSNAEVKFSALDLLHQNNAVNNYLINNSITSSTTNVLQRYFMVTIAYYPRKFDKKK